MSVQPLSSTGPELPKTRTAYELSPGIVAGDDDTVISCTSVADCTPCADMPTFEGLLISVRFVVARDQLSSSL